MYAWAHTLYNVDRYSDAGVYTETKFCLYVCRLGSVSNLLPVNSILRTPIDGQKSLAQFAVPAECPSLLAFLDNQTIVGECLLLD